MCVEVFMPDGRVIDAVTPEGNAVFDGERPSDSNGDEIKITCLCHLQFAEIAKLALDNLTFPKDVDIYRFTLTKHHPSDYRVYLFWNEWKEVDDP